jgi:RecG-like helicase
MGLRDLAKRLSTSVEELEQERLQDRFAGLDITPIAEVHSRCAVHVAGEVVRTRLTPRSGVQTFEITVSDGTGSIVAMFTGRRHVAGLEHHRAVVLDGVPRPERGRLVMLNPSYTLLPSGTGH